MLSILQRLYKSIALLPSVMALCFLLFGLLLIGITYDYESIPLFRYFSVTGKADIQTILSFVIGGIFTLTIFSYTMVMNVLNRNINNYSPRLIPLILAEKHHQLILGFTTGTIMYSMVLSIAINNQNLTYFPSIGAPIAVLFSLVCTLLYIYFLHSVSQSIHVNYIIKEVYTDASNNLKTLRKHKAHYTMQANEVIHEHVYRYDGLPGYLHHYDIENIHKLLADAQTDASIPVFPGEFVYRNQVILTTAKKLEEKVCKKIIAQLSIDHTVTADVFETDIKHLVEVAVKASSPAINDPGTGLNAIHYLTQLFIDRLALGDYNCYQKDSVNIYIQTIDTKTLMHLSYAEMYTYMKDDPILLQSLSKSLRIIKEHYPQKLWICKNLFRMDN